MMMPPPKAAVPFRIGDRVRLPEGQFGILRYVGPISGKNGEFAGVELLDEWASQGRHNGEFNGYVEERKWIQQSYTNEDSEKYFATEVQNSGLFISYPKLINSWRQQQAASERRSSLTGGAPVVRAPRTPDVNNGSPNRRSIQVLPGSGIARHRQSFIGGTTPRRSQVASPVIHQNGSTSAGHPFKRPTSHALRPESVFPSLQEVRNQNNSPATSSANSGFSMRTASGTSSIGGESSGSESVLIHRETNGEGNEPNGSSSSAAVAQAVAMAVSQVQADAQKQIHELKQQLEKANDDCKEREQQLQEQTSLLRDLESTVVEFQNLKEAEEAEREANAPSEGNDSLAMDELKQQHAHELEERDRKMASLRTQLESRRSEFRETLDALQSDMQESNTAYVREIHSLQTKLMETEKLRSRVLELEQVVAGFEGNNGTNREVADQDAKAQIMKLAELENKLLEKDEKLNDMNEQLKQARQQLSDMALASATSSPIASPFSSRTSTGGIMDDTVNEKLKQQLKSERAQRMQLENEIQNLEAIIEQKIFKEEELESELELLRAQQLQKTQSSGLQNTGENSSRGEKATVRTPSGSSTYSQNAFSISAEKVPLPSDGLLDALPIESPKPISKPGIALASGNDFIAEALPDTGLSTNGHAITTKTPSPSANLPNLSPASALSSQAGEDLMLADGGEQAAAMKETNDTEPVVPIYHSPQKLDPAKGRDKWCGLCEREGHESIECPFEEEFWKAPDYRPKSIDQRPKRKQYRTKRNWDRKRYLKTKTRRV